MAIIFQILSTLGFVLFLIPLAIAMVLDGLGDWLGTAIMVVIAGFILLALFTGLWGGSAHIANKLTQSNNSIVRVVGYLSTVIVLLPIISLALAVVVLMGAILISPFIAIGYVFWEEYPNFLWGVLAFVMVIAVSLFFTENPKQDEIGINNTSE